MSILTVTAAAPLPPMSDQVRRALYEWLGGASNTKAINAANVDAVADFYRSIGYRKDWDKPIYRGLPLTLQQADDLLGGGTVKLKPRVAESWSMNPASSLRFMRFPAADAWNASEVSIGLLLSRPKPRRGSIIMDAPRFYATYAGTEHDVADERGGSDDYISYMRKAFTRECEMILRQQCKSCSLREVEGLALAWQGDARGMLPGYKEFMEKHGFKYKRPLGRDDKWGYPMYERLETGIYFCRFKGGKLVPVMNFPGHTWPPRDLSGFRALGGWKNKPAAMVGGLCPKLDLSRR